MMLRRVASETGKKQAIRQHVRVYLTLPYRLANGSELVLEGEGPTYTAAKEQLNESLAVWREALGTNLEVWDE